MARREPALARAAGSDQLRKAGAVMDTKLVVVRPLGEQSGRHDQHTQRQLPEGLDGGARQEIYSGCMGRVASRSHRCSCKLINVGCMVPARDLDVGEYLKVILHRAACAETVLLTRRLDLTLVHRGCPSRRSRTVIFLWPRRASMMAVARPAGPPSTTTVEGGGGTRAGERR